MKKNTVLWGALTSKPYEFKARPWELKSINTIDLFDSLGSNIRVDVRGSEIMRVLPLNNEYINQEWISDKARYAYDGLNRNRFINPMYKKNDIFVQTTWTEIFKLIEKKFKDIPFKNLIINTGNFTDLETLTVLYSQIKNIKLNTHINYQKNLNSDFQEYYTINNNIFNLKSKKVIVLVGINIRLENPVLNIKLKKLSISSDIIILYIGSKSNYNFNGIHLGNNIEILLNIIKGKHYICKVITNFLKRNNKNIKMSSKYKNSISIIFGNEINKSASTTKIVETLKHIKMLGIKWDFNILPLYMGKINVMETGVFINRIIKTESPNLYYSINSETLKKENSNDFIIFQGHHNKKIVKSFDIILPSTSWVEKSSIYINSLGYVQKTQFINLAPQQSRDDWKITTLLFNVFTHNELKTKSTALQQLSNVHQQLNKLSPVLMNNISIYKKKNRYQLNIHLNSFNCNNIILINMPFKTHIHNYYQLNSVDSSSKIMTNCYNSFIKTKKNFIK